MKKSSLLTVLTIFGMALFSGCASMHVWPEFERSAEDKMVRIEQKIGEGLKTGELSADQSQMFLTTLKGIRIDYTELRNKIVYQEEWNNLHNRLDVLGDEIDRALSRDRGITRTTTTTTIIEQSPDGERIATLQRNIDDGRLSGRLPEREEREFQARLDSIRSDYLRMTEGGRAITYEARTDISRRLDSLATDLDRYR